MIGQSRLLRSSTTLLGNRSFAPFFRRRHLSVGGPKTDGGMYMMKAGLPLILFCGLGVWVVANGIEGKNRERDLFQGRISK